MARHKTAKRPTPRKIGYAVVGLGHIAQAAVLPAFAHAKENSKLVALVSGDAKKQAALGKRYRAEVYGYDDYEACLASPDVDAVYLALPNHLHAEYAIRAARAGVHVLCEKPMAVSEAECRRMIQACDESDVRLMIAYRLHFDPANLQAIELVRKGKIGEPRWFNSSFSFQVKDDNIRVERDKGGGVLWDIGIYCINAARYLFRAEPTEVVCTTASGDDPRFTEVEEAVSATLKFPGEKLASFVASFGSSHTGWYEVSGAKGELRVDSAYEYATSTTWELWAGDQKKSRTVAKRDQFAPELVYFSDCVLEGRAPEPDGWEGLADVRIISALYQSAWSGQRVRIAPVPQNERPTGEQEIRKPAVAHEPPLVNAESATE